MLRVQRSSTFQLAQIFPQKNFPQNFHLPFRQVEGKIHSPDSKINYCSPGAIGHQLLCTLMLNFRSSSLGSNVGEGTAPCDALTSHSWVGGRQYS